MNELIKITEHQGKKVVSARELHGFLESKQDFSTWIKNRIEKYGLVENQDYVTAPQIYGTANGGHSTQIEYALTVDCAKELSMVEGNDKGKQARKYFIECEKRLKEVAQHNIPHTFSQALMLAAKQAEQIEQQQKLIEQQTPKAEFYDAVVDSKDAIDMGSVAKVLNMNIGRNR